MKVSRIQTLNLRRKTAVIKDAEGVPEIVWGGATQVKAEVWPASGYLQAQTYGDRINSIMNVKIQGSYRIVTEGNHVVYQFDGFSLCEGDGLRLYPEGAGYLSDEVLLQNENGKLITDHKGNVILAAPSFEIAVPDYKIISIKPYKPLKLEVERI